MKNLISPQSMNGIDMKIKMDMLDGNTARSTEYALNVAMLHGINRVNPKISITLWNYYDQDFYMLESVKLSKSDIAKLDNFWTKRSRYVIPCLRSV